MALRALPLPLLLAAGAAAAGTGPARARGHAGRWSQRPLFTPTCQNAVDDTGPEVDPTRNMCCGGHSAACPAKFATPLTPPSALPNYTAISRRDFHHVVDGPLLGNGNVGVAVGGGNLWNVSYPWLDLFIGTNSFWSVVDANRSGPAGTAGNGAAPCTMQLAVARLQLPPAFVGSAFAAEVDLDSATATVHLTSSAGVTVTLTLFVSPLAPVFWTELTASAPVQGVTLNTTVRDHFTFGAADKTHVNWPVPTSASCVGSSAASISRGTEPAEVLAKGDGVRGAVHHTIMQQQPKRHVACETTGATSAALTFDLAVDEAVTIATVVRVSRDPSCVVRPQGGAGAATLCSLGSDPVAAAAAIAADIASIPMAVAKADHQAHWDSFWNESSISLPQAPDTEAFWFGANYILNSAVPHSTGQDMTPPGLYGPWGTIDMPGWHGDYTIDYNYERVFNPRPRTIIGGESSVSLCSDSCAWRCLLF